MAFLNSLPARGDLVEIRLGPMRAWVACHPELVHRMLMDPRTFDKGGSQYDRLRALMGDGVVTCRQPAHRRQRTLLQPDFRASRVADYTELMGEEAESVCRTWRAGQRIDVSAAMMALTTRVTSRVLFSDSLDAATAAQLRNSLGTIVRGLFVRTVVPVDAPFRVPTPANRRYRREVDRLHGIIDSVIAARRRGTPRDDLLGTLLAAARDGGEDSRAGGEDTAVTEQEVHDQLITLLLTGVETTALCMASALSLLAQHPETERRLHSEVDTVLAGRRRPDLDDLPRLTYTRSAVTETLRHSPPGWLFTRVTTRETEFAGCRLPEGATVLYSPYLLHHDPASFPDPELFLPERWLPGSERATAASHRAMLPFATGSRKCLGDAFAMAEATVAVATIAGRWRLRHPPGPVEPPRPAVTFGPRSLPMICEPRSVDPVGTPPLSRSRTPRATVTSHVQDPRTAGDHGVDNA
ncbi:cytochrome P450 [Streptomyces sp. NBC_00878]|uniref:cytochrome P450 n=1 Tax=Streptomyces sp. NBC_00878 TaxID=2975854 RepID=UPI0022536D37|nr:cytochrome P450 [Streptomyces sp. NBC_00878]MCX4903009.1 cytochrome P450 [Streptomyces sp. NBC_00878]